MLASPPYGRRFAALFDLETVLLDLRPAWAFALEQAVAAVTGRRVDGLALADAYSWRPWAHALAVVEPDPAAAARIEPLCERLFETSALKRVRVPEGLAMTLDALREARIELGVVSRQRHDRALRQLEATGLDRFFHVLSPTPAGEQWNPAARLRECARYLGSEPRNTAFLTTEERDAAVAASEGYAIVPLAPRHPATADTFFRSSLAARRILDALLTP